MQHSTAAPNAADEERFRQLHKIGCIACRSMHYWIQPEIHHLVDKGTREHSGGHTATIPLCVWHHRGYVPVGLSAEYLEEIYGPSMALNKRAFVERFGNERALLATTDLLICRGLPREQ